MDFTMLESLVLPFTVKDYKSLCTLLGEPIKGGNSKKAQVKEWECWLDLEKQGRAFTIHEILEEPLPLQDGRCRGNNSKYLPLLEPLLLDCIARNGRLELTKRAWWQCVGMVNDRYSFNCKAHRDALQRYDERFTELIVRDFYRYSGELLSKTWNSLIRNLTRRGVIIVTPCMTVKEGKASRPATQKEEIDIAYAEYEILKEMGERYIHEVIFKGKGEDFYSRVVSLLQDLEYEISKYFTTYQIEYTHGKPPRLSKIERTSLLSELSGMILDALYKRAEKGYIDALESYASGESTYAPDTNYSFIMQDISEYLLKN